MADEGETYWRFDDPSSIDDTPYSHEHRVIRRTPKGVWLDVWGTEKFVLNGVGKRWAYPTKEDALASYIRRKQRAVGFCAAAHDKQKAMLDHALAGEVDKLFEFTLSGFGAPFD